MDKDFKVVKYKGRRQKPDRGSNFCGSELVVDYINVNIDVLLGKVNEAQDILRSSGYILELISCVEEDFSEINHLICYGLGSLSESYISRHQLAALLALKDHFKCPTSAYDPIFNPHEIDVLKRFGVNVIKKNDEAKHPVSSGITAVYFAHCSSQLVNNFLWANWNPNIKNCAILSNSFSSIIQRNDEKTIASLSCLRDILGIAKECKLKDTYEIPDVFNDLSIHSFPPNQITNPEFWSPRPEPNYQGQPLEFCKKEVVITLRQI